MPQTRLFVRGLRPATTVLFAALEAEFEEDGLPIACVELDEESGGEEISVYVEAAEADAAARRIEALAPSAGPVRREPLPDHAAIPRVRPHRAPCRMPGHDPFPPSVVVDRGGTDPYDPGQRTDRRGASHTAGPASARSGGRHHDPDVGRGRAG